MRNKSLFHRLTLGLLIGVLIMPTQIAQAQFGGIVYDPKNHTINIANHKINIAKKLEDAANHAKTFDNAVRQLTTLRGVLGKVEDMVAENKNAINTMANIGRTVRASIQLKEQVEAIIKTRLSMLQSIDDRLRNGLFDPDANLRDFEDYLRNSIGRKSQDTLANLDRLRKMDNTLERLYYELSQLEVKLAQTNLEKAILKNLKERLESRPESQSDTVSLASLNQKLATLDATVALYTGQITGVRNRIEERHKKYHVLMEERIRFGEQVDETTYAWSELNKALDDIQRKLQKF
jgi:chromosome segregation ATPase